MDRDNKVRKMVFDLATFDSVNLIKEIELPKKPKSLQDAVQSLGGDETKLLDLIYEGLVSEAKDNAREDPSGFHLVDDEDEVGEAYTGTSANEDKRKQINGAILGIAKLFGYDNRDKSLTAEAKRDMKSKAAQFIRDNPAMLASIQS